VAALLLLALTTAAGAQAKSSKDQVVLSGSVDIAPGQTVGTVVSVDGPVNIAGHVTGDVVAVSGPVRISGRVDGTVTLVSQRGILAPSAIVGGDLLYGDERPSIAAGARVNGKISDEGWSDLAGPGFGIVGHLLVWLTVSLSSLFLGLALLGFAPRAADGALATARDRLGISAAWGAGLFLGLPVLAVFAVVTLFALPLGLALLCALLPLAAVGYVTTAWLLGNRVGRPGGGGSIPKFLVGWVILRLLALIPFVGALVWLAATALGLGVLAVTAWRRGHYERPATAPASPAPPAAAAIG
jgi:cytoskeletal protein CcmA (bactofilin family)